MLIDVTVLSETSGSVSMIAMIINQVTRRHANDANSVIMMMMEEGGRSPQELVHSDWSK